MAYTVMSMCYPCTCCAHKRNDLKRSHFIGYKCITWCSQYAQWRAIPICRLYVWCSLPIAFFYFDFLFFGGQDKERPPMVLFC